MSVYDRTLSSIDLKSRRPRRLPAFGSLLLLSVCLVPLTGCAPKRMKADFIGFEKVYAETSNREVLLNLARLQNHDTTYFFKLGQIASSYRMAATLTGAGNYVTQGTGVGGGNATGGGTPGVTFENDPSFTFIPVNDQTSAQLLLNPIPAQTLYNLYQQGWRIDQLFRLMVDRIEVTVPSKAARTDCTVTTYRNVPPPARSKSDTSSDQEYLRDASSYATFLRVSAVVYGLQNHGRLLLRGTTQFVPFDQKSAIVSGRDAQGGSGAAAGGPPAGGGATAKSAEPAASDLAAAASKGQSWEYDTDKKQWLLGEQVFGAQFYLNGDQDEIKTELLDDPRFKQLGTGQSLPTVLAALSRGFSIEEPPSGTPDADTCAKVKSGGSSAHLVMRSLIGIMAAVAQEQTPFQALEKYPAPLPPAAPGDTALKFADAVPPVESLPTLRIQWNSEERDGPALVEVSYGRDKYEIADAKDPPVGEDKYWNRDMFRLINQLTAQVTVDISKFPLPGILQLHTD